MPCSAPAAGLPILAERAAVCGGGVVGSGTGSQVGVSTGMLPLRSATGALSG